MDLPSQSFNESTSISHDPTSFTKRATTGDEENCHQDSKQSKKPCQDNLLPLSIAALNLSSSQQDDPMWVEYERGWLYIKRKEYSKAIGIYLELLHGRESSLGSDRGLTSAVIKIIVELYKIQGMMERAEDMAVRLR